MQGTRDNHPYIPQVLDSTGDIYEPTDIQQEAAAMMSAGATALRTARKLGIPKATIREWQREAWFRKLQRQVSIEIYLQSMQMACTSMPALIRRLQEIADSRDSKPAEIQRAIAAIAKLADGSQSLVFEERSNDIQAALESERRLFE